MRRAAGAAPGTPHRSAAGAGEVRRGAGSRQAADGGLVRSADRDPGHYPGPGHQHQYPRSARDGHGWQLRRADSDVPQPRRQRCPLRREQRGRFRGARAGQHRRRDHRRRPGHTGVAAPAGLRPVRAARPQPRARQRLSRAGTRDREGDRDRAPGLDRAHRGRERRRAGSSHPSRGARQSRPCGRWTDACGFVGAVSVPDAAQRQQPGNAELGRLRPADYPLLLLADQLRLRGDARQCRGRNAEHAVLVAVQDVTRLHP